MLATARHRHLSLKGAMNSVYKIPSHLFKIHLISLSNLRLHFLIGILTSAFSKKLWRGNNSRQHACIFWIQLRLLELKRYCLDFFLSGCISERMSEASDLRNTLFHNIPKGYMHKFSP